MNSLTHLCAAFALILCTACMAAGCRMFPGETLAKGHSPLKPASPSPDSVAMEIIWARFPANDPVLSDVSWREIDETQIEPSVRRELVNNGLRAGVISGTMPEAIHRVLHNKQSSPDEIDPTPDEQNAKLTTEPMVHGRTRRIRRNQRSEIQASEIYSELPLLLSGGSELGGRTYEQAQAIYSLRVDPRPDRTAIVELTPELQYGEPKLRITGGEDGILRQASLRERKVFDDLKLTVRLAPGEMLVLMSLPDADSRLGHYFHTTDSLDGPQQKLILIRLAEVPPSDTFAVAK
jgi:hypothetical protein